MAAELVLYAELLIFLVGSFVYGFLSRELYRRPTVFPGNWAMRALTVCLTLWYAGCLVDELGGILFGGFPDPLETALDVGRGLAWVLSMPLLVHALWRSLPRRALSPRGLSVRRPGWYWLVPGYAGFAFFIGRAVAAFAPPRRPLADLAHEAFKQFLVHSSLCAVIAAAMLTSGLRLAADDRQRGFLRWTRLSLAALVGLNFLAALADALGGGQSWAEQLWLLSSVASGLALGVTFLYFVQRWNLLSLTLSFRSLRHFFFILGLVVLVMLAGPAVGAGASAVYERFVAWGLILAVLAGLAGTRLVDRLARRSVFWRRLLGRTVRPEELVRLTQRLDRLELGEAELREGVGEDIGIWLGSRTVFLERVEPAHAALWRAFEAADHAGFSRLDSPSRELSEALGKADLHAVFPLRVGGELAGVLGLGVSETGGGYEDGEMAAIALVLRQLGAALEVRRLLERRLADERRAATEERLALLGLVAASLAHELRNPLSSMKALAQTVREEIAALAPDGEQARDLGLIVEQIDRLHEVAKGILDFARPAEGHDVDLAALTRSACRVVAQEARRRAVSVDTSAVGDIGRVPGGPGPWQTVVFNLLLNATNHAPRGSVVHVRLGTDGHGVVFATENGGPPIAADLEERLFKPFASEGGTGLGLVLVRQRVAELGGTVEIVNEPEHILFRVRVPRPPERPRDEIEVAEASRS